MSLLVKAVLVALVTWLTFFDKYCTQFFTYRPIVIGPIIGLIMGDLKMGLMVGCTIELMFWGRYLSVRRFRRRRHSAQLLQLHLPVFQAAPRSHWQPRCRLQF